MRMMTSGCTRSMFRSLRRDACRRTSIGVVGGVWEDIGRRNKCRGTQSKFEVRILCGWTWLTWTCRLLHHMLHLDWIKIDDFWSRRNVAIGIRSRFGITPDPRSIFWLKSDLFAFYALDRSSQGAFYWCTEEFFDCYLMAKDEQELKDSLNPTRRKHLKAYLPGLARVDDYGGFQDSSEED
jgi:hypothetical protein